MGVYARSVIVIDDEQLVASCVSSVLQDFGFVICGSATCAIDALWLAERYRPDIAIVDIRLNGKMDGIDIGQILSERFNIAIVFLTGSYDNAVAIRLQALSSAAFLQKPFRPTRLLGAIEAALQASNPTTNAAVDTICEPVPRTQVNVPRGRSDKFLWSDVIRSSGD